MTTRVVDGAMRDLANKGKRTVHSTVACLHEEVLHITKRPWVEPVTLNLHVVHKYRFLHLCLTVRYSCCACMPIFKEFPICEKKSHAVVPVSPHRADNTTSTTYVFVKFGRLFRIVCRNQRHTWQPVIFCVTFVSSAQKMGVEVLITGRRTSGYWRHYDWWKDNFRVFSAITAWWSPNRDLSIDQTSLYAKFA